MIYLTEEIVRALVGSIGLVLAIPVTTGIAVLVMEAVGTRGGASPARSGTRGLWQSVGRAGGARRTASSSEDPCRDEQHYPPRTGVRAGRCQGAVLDQCPRGVPLPRELAEVPDPLASSAWW